jgi:CRP/FNR family cyclic AMP-dependent transcriptional regulator
LRTVDELVREAPIFAGMGREHLELIAGCAGNQSFRAGEYLMREGDPADRFYVLRSGRVALETFVPERGSLTVETIESGEVLGWSWLVPPYRTQMDSRALETTRTIAFDGACLRGKCEQDAVLGYGLMQRFVPVIVDRLQATRVRLLDVFGHVAAG